MRAAMVSAGRIVNAHGVRGEVRVLPRDGDPALLARLPSVYLDGRSVVPQSVRVHKGFALVKLPGVETMDDALALKGKELFLDRARAGVPEDVFFDEELLGLDVFDGATGTRLGELTAVEAYPAHKIYTVRGEKTWLIPAVRDAFILSVDLERNRMEVRVWEGLADDEH